jgi:hypothetical protein
MIYSKWSTFVKIIAKPATKMEAYFAKKMQEAAWKDIERAFDVLQARFAHVRGSAKREGTISLPRMRGI